MSEPAPRTAPNGLPYLRSRQEAERGRFFDARPAVVREVMAARDPVLLVCGPVGTGKTRTALERVRQCCLKYPGCRWLLARSTRRALTQSGLVTWEEKVVVPGDLVPDRIRRDGRGEYRFPNGSVVVVAGLDDPVKVRSAEYDGAFILEATEVVRDAAEEVAGRLRNGVMPYQQLIMDCNPGPPTHWLKQDSDAGRIRRIDTRLTDNPRYFDPERKAWTPAGEQYRALLERTLTGTRRLRLLDGLWAQSEGVVYDGWDARVHVLPNGTHPAPDPIPPHWPRYWAVDFGFTNPLAWLWVAEDPDGRLYLYREVYQTGRLVKDVAEWAVKLSAGEPRPAAIVTDHDPEAIAQIERVTGYRCTPADKADRRGGIQQVADRLKVQADGRPRLYVLRDALAHDPDPKLVAEARPVGFASEVEGYVWNPSLTRGEEPLKLNDHSCDALRYLCAFLDGRPTGPAEYGTGDAGHQLPGGTFGDGLPGGVWG